jgi:hypothetical protein
MIRLCQQVLGRSTKCEMLFAWPAPRPALAHRCQRPPEPGEAPLDGGAQPAPRLRGAGCDPG